jgi:hypothetical protein
MARVKAYTIWYDPETSEIDGIEESLEFQSESPLARADVLQDILGEFTEIYNRSMGTWNNSMQQQRYTYLYPFTMEDVSDDS